MSRPTPAIYKTTTWPACNEALKRLGSLTIWFDPEMIWPEMIWPEMIWPGMIWPGMIWPGMIWPGMIWPGMIWDAVPTGRRGRQQSYSDAAIQTCLSMKVPFGMALRQTTGFVESLLRLVGLEWAVPDFSTLSRRQKTLQVPRPRFVATMEWRSPPEPRPDR